MNFKPANNRYTRQEPSGAQYYQKGTEIGSRNRYQEALAADRASSANLQFERHRMATKKQDMDIANKLLNDFSQKYPLGDEKSETELGNFRFQQPEQYAELSKAIKKGIPGSVINGEIVRRPAYKALLDKHRYEKDALEEKVLSGQANKDETMRYAKSKGISDAIRQAESIASTGDNTSKWDKASPFARSNMVKEIANQLLQARAMVLSQKANQQSQEDITQPQGFFGNAGQAVDSFFAGFGGNKNTPALAQSQPQPSVPQGVQPSPVNNKPPKVTIPNYTVRTRG